MSDQDREVLFAQRLAELKKLGRTQGGQITDDQITELFGEFVLPEEQLKLLHGYLEQNHIRRSEQIESLPEAVDSLAEWEDSPEPEGEDRKYLDLYLKELEELPVYTDGQKKAYTMSAMAGDSEARQHLINIYLKDVVQIAKLYSNQGVLMEDLIGEGNVALITGVTMLDSQDSPDDCEGMLIKLVMDAMEELITDSGSNAEVEAKALRRVNTVSAKADELFETLGRKVTIAELKEETGLSEKAIRDAIRISGFALDSIDLSGEEL
jgi:RNA polymerase primary sigma factor